MGEHSNHVQTEFTVADHATHPLGAIAKAAERTSEAFEHASHLAGTFGTIAGVVGGGFTLHKAIEGTSEFLQAAKRVQQYTGATTDNAGAMLDMFQGIGVEAGEAERSIAMMSKAGQRLEYSMAGANGQAMGMTGHFKALGIDLNKGPVEALMKMSKLAQEHKLHTADLQLMYRMQPKIAAKFMEQLERGPKAVMSQLNQFKALGIATDENVERAMRMEETQNRIKQTWSRITMIVGAELLPVVNQMLEGVAGQLDDWLPKAKQFGEVLGGFLREHLGLVKQITKVLLLNFTLQKVTGGDLVKHGQSGMKFILGGGKYKPGGLAGELANMPEKFMTGPQKIASMFIQAFSAASPLLSAVARFSAIGGIALLVYGAFEGIKDNVLGVRDNLVELWDRITDRFAIWEDLLSPLFGSGGQMSQFFKVALPGVVMLLGEVVDGINHTLQAMVIYFKMATNSNEAARAYALSHPLETWEKSWSTADNMLKNRQQRRREEEEMDKMLYAIPLVAPKERQGAPYMDFRGSRFDITQKFAEGFDPDRIAVAFSNDLASMGERRVQSSTLPMGLVR